MAWKVLVSGKITVLEEAEEGAVEEPQGMDDMDARELKPAQWESRDITSSLEELRCQSITELQTQLSRLGLSAGVEGSALGNDKEFLIQTILASSGVKGAGGSTGEENGAGDGVGAVINERGLEGGGGGPNSDEGEFAGGLNLEDYMNSSPPLSPAPERPAGLAGASRAASRAAASRGGAGPGGAAAGARGVSQAGGMRPGTSSMRPGTSGAR
ncbi:unnamed protein product, partial [Chrysoparadoxa australica]